MRLQHFLCLNCVVFAQMFRFDELTGHCDLLQMFDPPTVLATVERQRNFPEVQLPSVPLLAFSDQRILLFRRELLFNEQEWFGQTSLR